jgi:hypothetical protein
MVSGNRTGLGAVTAEGLRLILAATMFSVLTLGLIYEATKFGHHIHASDIGVDYVWGACWSIVLGASIWMWPVSSSDKSRLAVLWIVRVVVVLLMMLPYEGHYELDAFTYFERSATRFRSLPHATSGTAVMLRIVGAFNSLFPASYHATKVSFAMVGLLAVYLFYRAAVLFLEHEDERILWLLGLTPSILFWGSILGKDPIVMLGVSLYTYGTVVWSRHLNVAGPLWIALGIGIAAAIRIWMAPIMIAPLVLVTILRSRFMWRVVLGAVVSVALAVAAPLALRWFSAASTSALLEQLADRGQGFDRGGSATGEVVRIGSLGDAVKFLPWGAFTALFRPLPGEVRNPFGIAAGLEDLVFLALLFRALVRFKLDDLREPLVLWAVLFVIAWSLPYAFISVHNMGSAVRYRVQVLPMLLLLLLYVGRRRMPIESVESPMRRGRSAARPEL